MAFQHAFLVVSIAVRALHGETILVDLDDDPGLIQIQKLMLQNTKNGTVAVPIAQGGLNQFSLYRLDSMRHVVEQLSNQSNPLTEEEIQWVINVIGTLTDEFEPALELESSADQTSFNAKKLQHEACTNTDRFDADGDVTTLNTGVTRTRTKHRGCRRAEKSFGFMGSGLSDLNELQWATKYEVPALSTVCDKISDYKDDLDAYKLLAPENTVSAGCGEDQILFETAHCAWLVAKTSACTGFSSCIEQVDLLGLQTDILQRDGNRRATLNIVQLMKCRLQAIVTIFLNEDASAVAPTDTCTDTTEAPNTGHYNLSIDIPASEHCSTDGDVTNPIIPSLTDSAVCTPWRNQEFNANNVEGHTYDLAEHVSVDVCVTTCVLPPAPAPTPTPTPTPTPDPLDITTSYVRIFFPAASLPPRMMWIKNWEMRNANGELLVPKGFSNYCPLTNIDDSAPCLWASTSSDAHNVFAGLDEAHSMWGTPDDGGCDRGDDNNGVPYCSDNPNAGRDDQWVAVALSSPATIASMVLQFRLLANSYAGVGQLQTSTDSGTTWTDAMDLIINHELDVSWPALVPPVVTLFAQTASLFYRLYFPIKSLPHSGVHTMSKWRLFDENESQLFGSEVGDCGGPWTQCDGNCVGTLPTTAADAPCTFSSEYTWQHFPSNLFKSSGEWYGGTTSAARADQWVAVAFTSATIVSRIELEYGELRWVPLDTIYLQQSADAVNWQSISAIPVSSPALVLDAIYNPVDTGGGRVVDWSVVSIG